MPTRKPKGLLPRDPTARADLLERKVLQRLKGGKIRHATNSTLAVRHTGSTHIELTPEQEAMREARILAHMVRVERDMRELKVREM